MSVAILAQASSRPDIMSDVAFFGLLQLAGATGPPLHGGGDPLHRGNVATAGTVALGLEGRRAQRGGGRDGPEDTGGGQKACGSASGGVEAGGCQGVGAREAEGAVVSALGRRGGAQDGEDGRGGQKGGGGDEKGCSGGAEAGEAFEAEEDLATEERKNVPHPLPLPCHPSPLLLCSACRNKDHFGLGRGSVLLEVSWSFLRYVPRNYRLNLKGKNASQDTIPEFPTNDAKP